MSATATQTYMVQAATAYHAAVEAVTEIGWGGAQRRSGHNTDHSPNWRHPASFSEKVRITVTEKNAHSEIAAESGADWQLYDWGKNQHNSARFFAVLNQRLPALNLEPTRNAQVGASTMNTTKICCCNCAVDLDPSAKSVETAALP